MEPFQLATTGEKKRPYSELWESFLSGSNNLTTPCLIRNAVTQSISQYQHLTGEVIRGLTEDKEPRMRIWVDNAVHDEYKDKMRDVPLSPEDDILLWSKKVFGNQKFGIIVNDCEKYSNVLNYEVLSFLQPLLDGIGYPITGIDFTYFIGNYGYTPLGFHVDPPGDSVIHLHLGPGDKEIFLLKDKNDIKDYHKKKQGSGKVYVAPGEYINNAKRYHIKAGDLFYMPSGEIHIGKSDDLSVGLTVWLRQDTQATITEKIFSRLFLKIEKSKAEEDILPFARDLEEVPNIKNDFNPDSLLSESINISLPLEKLMHQELMDYRYEIMSNGGLAIKPLVRKQTLENASDHCIKNVKPFMMLYKRIDDDLLKLFVRGHPVYVPNSSIFKTLIDNLNTGQIYSIYEMVNILEDWDEDMTLYILEQMYKFQGIEVYH